MQSKTAKLMMAIGAVIAVIGLAVMPAGLGENSADRNLLGSGAAIFAMGALVVALGIYFKAKSMNIAPGQKSAEAATPNRPLRGGCDRCQVELPVIQCKVHQQHLCGNCLSEHYDFRSCVYAPSTRRLANKSAAAGRGK